MMKYYLQRAISVIEIFG